MSREEFEARKADLKRKREMERCSQRYFLEINVYTLVECVFICLTFKKKGL